MNWKELWNEKEFKKALKSGLTETITAVEELNKAYKLDLEIRQQRIKVTDEQTRVLKG